jgi:hypothetical protein
VALDEKKAEIQIGCGVASVVVEVNGELIKDELGKQDAAIKNKIQNTKYCQKYTNNYILII